jgi:hypothetical protein
VVFPQQKWAGGSESRRSRGRDVIGRKRRHGLEEVVAKLRQVEVMVLQGKPVSEAVRVSPSVPAD